MLYFLGRVFLFLIAPTSVLSLYCYSCNQLIVLDYPVTSDTIPSFSDCELTIGTECLITVVWNQNMNISSIQINSRNNSVIKNLSGDIIMPMALMEIGPDEETPLISHSLFYSCMSNDQCNNEVNLKKLLNSLIIKDQFYQELYPLIKIISTFNSTLAACFNFNNSTTNCPETDLDHCRRCQISLNTQNEEICASCPLSRDNANAVIHSKTFLLNNQTQIFDHIQLDCQMKECNTIVNVNRISQTSTITFDFKNYFQN